MADQIGAPGFLHDPVGFVSAHLRVARPGSTCALRALAIAAALLLGVSQPLVGQRAEVSQEENFRNEPNGGLLAVLAPGTPLTFHARRENWVEATMEGWVWSRSLLTTQRSDYDLVVSTGEGENLRDRPSGEILGRMEDGTFLEEVERIPGWIRVRRRGWIWSASVTVDDAAAAPNAGVDPVPVTDPPPAANAGASSRTPRSAGAPVEVIRGGLAVLTAPDGDTLSVLAPNAEVSVVDREGNWARVRLEGWVWQPTAGEAGETPEPAGTSASGSTGLTPQAVTENPAAARGRIVTWELQYISLERAESVRTDFFEGEPFLLMRPAGDSSGRFVYVAIPEDRISIADRLVDLQTVTVVARVRTGSSRLTGSPILDLIEIR